MSGAVRRQSLKRLWCALLAIVMTLATVAAMMFTATPITTAKANDIFPETTDLATFLEQPDSKVTVAGLDQPQNNKDAYVYTPGEEVTLDFVFAENPNGSQFKDTAQLEYKLPQGFTPKSPEVGQAKTFPVTIHKDNQDITIEGNTWKFEPIENSDNQYQLLVNLNQKDKNFKELAATHNVTLTISAKYTLTNPAKETQFAANVKREFVAEGAENAKDVNGSNQGARSQDSSGNTQDSQSANTSIPPTSGGAPASIQPRNGDKHEYQELNLWMQRQPYRNESDSGVYVYWTAQVNENWQNDFSGNWFAVEFRGSRWDQREDHYHQELRKNMRLAGEGITFQAQSKDGMISTYDIPWEKLHLENKEGQQVSKDEAIKWSLTLPRSPKGKDIRYRIVYKTLVTGPLPSNYVTSTAQLGNGGSSTHYWTAISGGSNPFVDWDKRMEYYPKDPGRPSTDLYTYQVIPGIKYPIPDTDRKVLSTAAEQMAAASQQATDQNATQSTAQHATQQAQSQPERQAVQQTGREAEQQSPKQTKWKGSLYLPNWNDVRLPTEEQFENNPELLTKTQDSYIPQIVDTLPHRTINGRSYTDLPAGAKLKDDSKPVTESNVTGLDTAASYVYVQFYSSSNGNTTKLELGQDYTISYDFSGNATGGGDQPITMTLHPTRALLNKGVLAGTGELQYFMTLDNSQPWLLAAMAANADGATKDDYLHKNQVEGRVNNTTIVPADGTFFVGHAADLINQVSTKDGGQTENLYPMFVKENHNDPSSRTIPVWFFRVMLDKTSLTPADGKTRTVTLKYDKNKFRLVTPDMFGGIKQHGTFYKLLGTSLFLQNSTTGQIDVQGHKDFVECDFTEYFKHFNNSNTDTQVLFPDNKSNAWPVRENVDSHYGFVYALTPTENYLDEISQDADNSAGKTITFSNEASFTNTNQEKDTTLTSSADFKYTTSTIRKTELEKDTNNNTIKFGIDVNPAARDLSSGDTVDVYDEMSENLRWDSSGKGNSLKVMDVLTGQDLTKTVPFQKIGKKFKFTVPDSKSIRITLLTRVYGTGGNDSTVDYQNTATLNDGSPSSPQSSTVRGSITLSNNAFGEGDVGTVYVYKYAETDLNRPLEGAVFKLWVPVSVKGTTEYRETTSTYTTNSAGYVKVENYTLAGKQGEQGLEYGKTYKLQEIEAPNGYKLNSTLTEFTLVNSAQTGPGVVNPVPNQGTVLVSGGKGQIVVKKTDSAGTPRPLPSATLCVGKVDANAAERCEASGADGVVVFNGIDNNADYVLRESAAPSGFVLTNKTLRIHMNQDFEASSEGAQTEEVSLDGHKQIAFVFRNQVAGTLNVRVVLPDGSQKSAVDLSGAEFTLTSKQSPDTETLTTDASGYLSFGYKGIGSFTLSQVAAPKGFEPPANAEWTLEGTNVNNVPSYTLSTDNQGAVLETSGLEGSGNYAYTVKVTNTPIKVTLPSTGDVGRANYFGLGIAILMAAIMLGLVRKSRL